MKRTVATSKWVSLFADSMLFVAVLGWAVSFPIAKLAMTDWGNHKYFFLAGRFWLAFAIFGLLALYRNYSWRQLTAHAKPGFWLGLTLMLAFSFQYEALKLSPAGEVAFITAMSSVLVPVGMWIIFKEKAKAGMWIGLVVATAGVMLVKYKGAFSFDYAGWLALFGAAGMAAYIILLGRFLSQKENGKVKYEKVPFLTMQFLVLATASTLLSLFTEVSSHGLPPWSGNAVFAVVFMAVVATALAFFIQSKYQPMTSPERVALVFTLESPFAALLGYLLLGEPFTLTMVIGAAMIFAGVAFAEVLAARESSRSEQKPEEPQGPQGTGFAEVLPERRSPALTVDALSVLPGPTQTRHSYSK